MKKKPPKESKPTPEYDSERETRVLLERVNKNVELLAEQHGSIVTKLDGHDKRFDRIEAELSAVQMAVLDNGREIKKLKTGQEEIKQKLDTVTTDHEQRIQKLETAIR